MKIKTLIFLLVVSFFILSVSSSFAVNDKNFRLQSCLARQDAVKTRSENLINLGNDLLKTFDDISMRAQNFYTKNNLNVSNYSSLIADIASKRVAVETSLTQSQAVLNGFNCSTGNPKYLIQLFNSKMKSAHQSLKNYKASIKNLIVAVHSESSRPTEGVKQ